MKFFFYGSVLGPKSMNKGCRLTFKDGFSGLFHFLAGAPPFHFFGWEIFPDKSFKEGERKNRVKGKKSK